MNLAFSTEAGKVSDKLVDQGNFWSILRNLKKGTSVSEAEIVLIPKLSFDQWFQEQMEQLNARR